MTPRNLEKSWAWLWLYEHGHIYIYNIYIYIYVHIHIYIYTYMCIIYIYIHITPIGHNSVSSVGSTSEVLRYLPWHQFAYCFYRNPKIGSVLFFPSFPKSKSNGKYRKFRPATDKFWGWRSYPALKITKNIQPNHGANAPNLQDGEPPSYKLVYRPHKFVTSTIDYRTQPRKNLNLPSGKRWQFALEHGPIEK